jgi:chromosome segregation ATPase
MIEPIMFFALGCLAASLLALVFLPLVHSRAVRLTTRRLEGAIPVSITEIHADKDQLRAEFAMQTRRLELSLEQARTKAAAQSAEVGRKLEVIGHLKRELEDKTLTISALEVRDKPLLERVQRLDAELAHKSERLQNVEQLLATTEASLEKASRELAAQSLALDSQRIELVAATTQIATLKDKLQKRDRELGATQVALEKERAALEKASREVIEIGEKSEKFAMRAERLERDYKAAKADSDRLGKRVYELDTQVVDQTRRLSDATNGREQVAAQLEEAGKREADLRRDIANAQGRHASEVQTLLTEKNLVEAELERNREERSKLKREIAALKRELETNGAEERAQNAILRESISDVAAEVVRLTSALEGPGSPIETILSEQSAPPMAPVVNGQDSHNGEHDAAELAAKQRPASSLADRIRALQTRAARAPTQAPPP